MSDMATSTLDRDNFRAQEFDGESGLPYARDANSINGDVVPTQQGAEASGVQIRVAGAIAGFLMNILVMPFWARPAVGIVAGAVTDATVRFSCQTTMEPLKKYVTLVLAALAGVTAGIIASTAVKSVGGSEIEEVLAGSCVTIMVEIAVGIVMGRLCESDEQNESVGQNAA